MVLLGWCIPHTSYDRWVEGWLKFEVLPGQNFTRKYYLLQLDALLTFSLAILCFHTVHDWKSLIKLFDGYMNPGPAISCDHLNLWHLENGR